MPATARKAAVRRRRAPLALARYNAKRDFDVTAEPRGEAAPKSGRSFVIQQHDATRMHYDFRLELGGVLLSWAVPKGPSLDPADKRLAVQTEDHPVTYQNFEGNIPEGEYGGGPVIVWDRGTWVPEGDAKASLKKGHLTFSLDGEKLHGKFSLVRLRGAVREGPKSNWLLMKRSDEHVRKGRAAQITVQQPQSVITGRTVKEVGHGDEAPSAEPRRRAATAKPSATSSPRKRAPVSATKASGKSKRSKMPDLAELEPQLATLVDRAPQGDNWLYEIKFDGYRMLAAVRDGKARLRSRNHLDWTKTLPHIAQALGKLKVKQAVLDGELCYVGEDGRSSFQKLQNAMPRGSGTGGDTSKLAFYLFDVLFHDGVDVRAEPLVDRKHRLRILLGSKPPSPLVYSDHLEGDGHSNLLQACAAGLEGLIAKRRDAPYRGGRTQDWLKLKCQKRQEFVIAGMIRASGTRQGFRSLVLAVREGKALKFAGRVGTGFTQESLRDIAAQLARRVVTDSPLDDPPRLPGVVWVKPDLVAEIEYTEMTADGSLRHPSFQGLRRDKPARQVTRERAVPTGEIEDGADGEAEGGARRAAATGKKTRSRKTAVAKRSSADDGDDTVEGVRITHPERVMDEASGTTKLELARYHAAVGEHLMPYVDNRPLALVRCPQGDARQCFFQKHRMAGLGSNVHKSRIAGNEVLYVDSLQGVLELVQFNVVEFHAWGASMAEQDRPDWFVIDLDPDTALTFSHVVDAALEVRELLLGVGLQSWVKTTGGKGLHVVVPLRPEAYWDTVKGFTQAIAQALEARDPERYVATMSKAKRKNRIFVDYLRNGQGATAIVPYSPRTRPGMTVAMPVQWRDLRRVDPREFTVGSVPQYLARRRSDPWKDFLSSPQRLPDLDAGAVRPSRRRR